MNGVLGLYNALAMLDWGQLGLMLMLMTLHANYWMVLNWKGTKCCHTKSKTAKQIPVQQTPIAMMKITLKWHTVY